jgi:PAS domain S-box-containing protein
MKPTKKSGKEGRAKGAGKKTAAGARPAKTGKRASAAVGSERRQERDRWRELVETSAAWIWETDADLRHTYTNAFVTRCLGYQPAEFLRLNTLDLIHPDDRGPVSALVRSAVTRQEGWFNQVLRWRHKDGSWRYIESSGSPLFDEQGTFLGFCGIDRDITEQKRAAEDLRRSEEKYRGLFENAIDAICIVDRDQNYLDVNRRAIELFGYSREEILSMNIRDMLPPEQLVHSDKEFAKLTESGAYEKFIGRVRRKDGSCIDVEVSASAIVEQGQVVGSRDIIRDITDRRKAEALLRDSERRMRSIVESLPMGMHLYNLEPDGRLVFIGANPAADRILGVDNRIFIGKTIEEAFPPLKDTEVPQRYRDAARSGRSWQTESIEYQNDLIKGAFEVHAFQTAPDTMVAAFEDITGRKRSEAALKQSEEKYRRLYNETPVLLQSIDRNGILVEVNDYWLKTLGYDRSEVLGRKATDFLTAASRKYAQEVVQPAFFRDGAIRNVAYRLIKKNGDSADVLVSATAERDAAGNVVRSQAVIEDITERKRAEEALRESESRYRAIVESQAEFVVRYQPGGIITFVNDTLCRYTNMRREDLLGRSYYPFMHPDDRDAFVRSIEALDRKNPSMVAEARVVLPDGRESWHQWTHLAIFNDRGDLVEYQGTGRDVTELKQAEARISESEKKYRTLFESSNDGIFILDLDGNFIDANPAAYARLGYTKDELLSLHISKLDTPAFSGQVPERIREIKERGFAVFESANRRKDGSVMQIEVSARLLEYEGKTVVFSVNRDITERKRAQEELAGQKAMLQQILDTSSVAIFLVDKAGRITQANKRMTEMFGQTMTELAGREYVELIHPTERETGRAKMLALLASKVQSVDVERHYRRKDGTEFWGHLAGKRFYDIHGSELGLIGVLSDVTERKRAEDALRKSEKMLQTIIDAEPECVKLLDENACLIMMNRAGLGMLQVESLDQVKGQCVCPLVTSEYREAFLDLTRRVFRGESGTLSFEMVGMKGRHLWMETHAVPLRNEKDEIIAVLGVTRDVTERKKAEDALRQSEARFRDIIENASVGILVANVETREFLYANPAICRLLGYSQQDFHSLTAMDITVPEERQESSAGFQAHAEGKLDVTERTLRRKDGSTVRMSINSVRMEFDGQPGLVGFFTDVTEKRLLEEERLKAQKLESLGTLAGGIAHDFNNLLQGIFGYISMAKLTIDQREKSLAMLVQAEKALHQSVNLTSQLLTFSKGGKPVKKATDLRSVIENAVKFALSGSRVSYDLSFGHDLHAVEADEGQIGQVIQNIVLNAEQSMPLGGRIDIEARNVPPARAAGLPLAAADGLVEIVVRDQGTGIPSEHLPRLFDPYFTTKEKGSGLGLATSYSIVKNHDGMIDVSSVLGKGSTFTVYLPAIRAAQVPAASSAPGSCVAGRSCRVLVMDDEEIVRLVAGELLRELGHEAEFAENGGSAIEKYRQALSEGRPFDAVILDLTIRGGMGGLETLLKLKEIDPGVNAVVSSGYSDDDETADYKTHGFRSYLKKPYNIEQLQDVLNGLTA